MSTWSPRRLLLVLRVVAVTQLAFYAALIVLFANVPAGWVGKVGYGWGGLAVFRGIFTYPAIALGPQAFTLAGQVVIVCLWAGLVVALLAAGRLEEAGHESDAARSVFALACAQHALLVVFMPPVLSSDLYHYAALGRMFLAGVNPYTHPISSMPPDPISALANWRGLSSHYGAFFTWLSAGAAWLAGPHPVRTAWVFKGMAAAANLTGAMLAWRLARRAPRGGLATLVLCALSPIFVIESAGNGHNEAVMMMLALGGLVAWREGKTALATVAFTLSTLVKFVTGVLPLLLIARALAEPSTPRRRVALVAKVAGIAAVVTLALYAPFGWTPSSWGLGATSVLLVKGKAIIGGATPQNVSTSLAIFAASVVVAVALAAFAPRQAEMELAAVLSVLFVVAVFDWANAWYFIPGATLAAAAPPSRTRPALRWLTFTLTFGMLMIYPLLLPAG